MVRFGRMALVSALIGVAGCAPPTSASWLQGGSYRWTAFNHRLSHLTLQLGEGQAYVAVVGGASTTATVFDEDGTCIDSTCFELPVVDSSTVGLRVQQAVSSTIQFGRGRVSMVADAAGATMSTKVGLGQTVDADTPVRAFIAGWSLSTDRPLSTEAEALSCYDPRHGWHPRAFAVSLDPVIAADGRSVDVAVTGRFEAGPSQEEERACVDAIAQFAEVDLEVDLVVAVGGDADGRIAVDQQAAWEHRDEKGALIPQPQPTEGTAADMDASLAWGWSSLAWDFQIDDPERGAYLRTVLFDADPSTNTALGFANNESPITQLSGFGMAFSGVLEGVGSDDLSLTTWNVGLSELPAALDDEGVAEVTTVPFGDPTTDVK